jgi:hypothetical protein
MQDVVPLAYEIGRVYKAVGEMTGRELAEALAQPLAQRAQQCLQRGDRPSNVRAWSDLLYGLTQLGLVVSEQNSSPVAHNQVSHALQRVLQEAVQRLPDLLKLSGCTAQDVSTTLLAFAWAGYRGDLGPVTAALASNLVGCLGGAKPQANANVLWALAKLDEAGVVGTSGADVFSCALDGLLRQLDECNAQDFSNALSCWRRYASVHRP